MKKNESKNKMKRGFMKKSLSMAMLVSLLSFSELVQAHIAHAASTSFGPVPVSATVGGGLTLTVVMRKNDFSGPIVTNMDFGRLVDIGTGTLRSSSTSTTGTGAVDVFLSANSQGLPYTITQTGTALSSGSASLPAGACVVVPVYAQADNGGAAQPQGATLGTPGTWVSSGKVLYASESGNAAMRTIQAIYSISDDPAAGATTGVPVDQPGGDYDATITFTATA